MNDDEFYQILAETEGTHFDKYDLYDMIIKKKNLIKNC